MYVFKGTYNRREKEKKKKKNESEKIDRYV